MVKETLTSEMIESGKRLIQRMDKNNLNIQSAFWYYLEDSEKWRLFLGSPLVREEGPKMVYQKIKNVLQNIGSDIDNIELKDISVIEDDHSLVELISTAIGVIPDIAEVRFSRNAVNGHFIEDALIYRLKYQQKVA